MASSPADAAGLEHTPARRWRTLHAHCKKGKCKVHKHRTAWLSGEDRGLRSWGSWVRVRPRALFPRGRETSSAASATCPLRHCGIPAPRSWRKPHWRAHLANTRQSGEAPRTGPGSGSVGSDTAANHTRGWVLAQWRPLQPGGWRSAARRTWRNPHRRGPQCGAPQAGGCGTVQRITENMDRAPDEWGSLQPGVGGAPGTGGRSSPAVGGSPRRRSHLAACVPGSARRDQARCQAPGYLHACAMKA